MVNFLVIVQIPLSSSWKQQIEMLDITLNKWIVIIIFSSRYICSLDYTVIGKTTNLQIKVW